MQSEHNYFNSPELLEAERQHFRAECKLRCLTSALDRTNPEDFDVLMVQIEAAKDELQSAWTEILKIKLSAERT